MYRERKCWSNEYVTYVLREVCVDESGQKKYGRKRGRKVGGGRGREAEGGESRRDGCLTPLPA